MKIEGAKTHVRPDHYHRIARLVRAYYFDPREVWTLLRTGRMVKKWGYLVDGEHVDYDKYHEAQSAPEKRVRCEM
jgi:hypothetical protein